MKRLAFPALFVLVLLGFWVFSKSPGSTAPAVPPAQQQTTPPNQDNPAVKLEPLTEKEQMFAATLSPKNQQIFSVLMSRKQRTMAMEMVIENNRSGGSLTSNQIVEQLSDDLHLQSPPTTTPPPVTSDPSLQTTPPGADKSPAPAAPALKPYGQ